MCLASKVPKNNNKAMENFVCLVKLWIFVSLMRSIWFPTCPQWPESVGCILAKFMSISANLKWAPPISYPGPRFFSPPKVPNLEREFTYNCIKKVNVLLGPKFKEIGWSVYEGKDKLNGACMKMDMLS